MPSPCSAMIFLIRGQPHVHDINIADKQIRAVDDDIRHLRFRDMRDGFAGFQGIDEDQRQHAHDQAERQAKRKAKQDS